MNSATMPSAAVAAKRKDQVKHRTALELLLRSSLVVAHLLAAVDQTLLCRGDTLLLLDALLDLRDLVVGFDVELDLLAGEGSYFDLHGGLMCAGNQLSI
jgi:hypothetical protein